MAIDLKKRKKIMIRVGAVIGIVLLLGGLMWMIFGGDGKEEKPSNLGESDSMLPLDPSQITATVTNTSALVLNPTSIMLDPAQPVAEFSIMASGAPIVIEDVRMPQEMANAITIQNIDCPAKPAALLAGAACRVSVKLIGNQPVNTSVEVLGKSQTPTGVNEIKQSLAVSTTGTGAIGPSGLPINGALNGGPGDIPAPINSSTIPVQASAPPPPNPTGLNYGPDSQVAGQTSAQQMRSQYLQARRGGAFNHLQPNQMKASPKSPYSSWNAIGVQGGSSSYPTDMSRVLTPDKSITAVLQNIIDTRVNVTAVAMVDRDVYGNNGRTVVIPRGSKLIGTVGESSERVGIAWKQLIRPDGVRFMFDAASGDTQGRGGIPGRINERLLQRYGFSLLPSVVAASITAALGGNQVTQSAGVGGVQQQKSARSVASEILSEPLNNIASDIYRRKSSVPTQITVPAGTRITVWVVNDLRLKPMGETDETATDQNQGSNIQRQNSTFQFQSDKAQSKATVQPLNGAQQAAQGTQQTTSDGRSEGDETINSVDAGSVDANGNYIPAGGSAPKPGPTTLNRNNSNFPSNNNPWK